MHRPTTTRDAMHQRPASLVLIQLKADWSTPNRKPRHLAGVVGLGAGVRLGLVGGHAHGVQPAAMISFRCGSAFALNSSRRAPTEIGRASCRERVGQYV